MLKTIAAEVSMVRYPYLLFDVDDTLFDFAPAGRRSFEAVCRLLGLPFSDALFDLFSRHNDAAWRRLERSEGEKERLVVERFSDFLCELGIAGDAAACNRVYLDTLSRCAFLLPHAVEVIRRLSADHEVYLVTNALSSVQRGRLRRSAIAPYVKGAFVAEDAGAFKPSAAYFDYVFAQVPSLTRENCLLVGDSLASDIQGANAYALPCCWYNPSHRANTTGLRIDYEIDDLRRLYEIV